MTGVSNRDVVDAALAERLSKMSPAKRALFLKSSGLSAEDAQRLLAATNGSGLPRRDPAEPIPMSYAQELLWRLERVNPGHAYNVPRSSRLRGPLNVDALRRALDEVVARHEALRTTLDLVDGTPRQIIQPPHPVPLDLVDLTSLPASEREEEARNVVKAQSQKPFDLATDLQLRAALIRIDADDHVLLIQSHHVSSDVLSRGILFRELQALYREAIGGQPAALPPLRAQFADFAAWQRRDLSGPRLEKLLSYWRERLAGARVLELPTDRRASDATDGGSATRECPMSLLEGIRRLNGERGTTLFMTMLAAVDVLLSRYTLQNDIVIGSPVSGRPHADLEGAIGYFVNTIAFRTSLEGSPSFAELLDRVRTTSLGAFEHQDVPYELLLTELSEAGRSGNAPLFNVVLSMLDGDAKPFALEGTVGSAFGTNRGAVKFDLLFSFREHERGLRIGVEYRRDQFHEDTAARMLGHLETLLAAAIAAPHTRVDELPLLTEHEQHQALVEWNDTAAAWPSNATLHGLFEAQVARRPDAVAVVCEGDALTYAELDRRANRLAWQLKARGVGPDSLVAVCLDKSVDTVAVLLGVLKAGGAYVPIDPAYPDDRIAYMLGDSEARVVIIDEGQVTRFSTSIAALAIDITAELVVAAEQWADGPDARDDAPPPSAAPSNLCYVIYTSGSTGRPKGVLIEHRNVVRLLFNDRFQFDFSERDVWTVFHSFSFDFSVWEMYGALLYGGRVVVVPRAVAQDSRAYLSLLADQGVTVLNQVPSAFYGLMQEELSRPTPTLSSLRYIIFGGEALQPALLRDWHERYPATTLVNMFGITETTVHVTFKVIGDAEIANGASNIGGPIPTLSLYVLDSQLQLVPIGITGELCVGGAGVARGYLKRPELTAERFVPHPFRLGERLYRSGDLGRLHPNGEIEYLGRRDAQVKIRGFRIELGEIEHVLAGHPSVRQAAVVAVGDHGDTQLAGYFVPTAPAGATPASVTALRNYLRERLPTYMVPGFLIPLDAIPISNNGKLDRAALPSPQAAASADARTSFARPRTTLEHQLVQIWKRLLDVKRVGIQDNFFDLGGHSLLGVRMLAEIEQMSGRRLSLASLFEDATIERLAYRIETVVHNEVEPPIITLPAAPDARPFIFVHGDVRAGGWYCRRLSQLLGPGTKLMVLPTVRRKSGDAVRTVEAMAAHHLAALRTAQPTGPYRLGGYCFGGTLAFEIAQQLRDAGETVERLILVDTSLRNAPFQPYRRVIDGLFPEGPSVAHLERRAAWLDRLSLLRRMNGSQRWNWFWRNVARRIPGATRPVPVAPVEPPSPLDEIWTRPGTKLIKFQARAANAYVPKPYGLSIDVIVPLEASQAAELSAAASSAADAQNGKQPGKRGWHRVTNDLRIRPIATSHVGLITTHLDQLAEQVRQALDRGEA